jgi:hypothetical protein
MPSLADNSPYTLVEAIGEGLDFLSTSVGGQAELLHPSDRRRFLCKPDVESLHQALVRRLSSPAVRARPSAAAASADRRWLRLHGAKRGRKSAQSPSGQFRSDPLVSVVLRSKSALSSLLAQDYGNIEICPLPQGIPQAKGEYLLFLDGPLRTPSTLRQWVQAAAAQEARAEVVATCAIASSQ